VWQRTQETAYPDNVRLVFAGQQLAPLHTERYVSRNVLAFLLLLDRRAGHISMLMGKVRKSN